ncbi:MAG: plastocyanin/azurin family copper-binding protein [Halobacteriales archaeon]|nr:plastocyanin/azurin family copper-binding protein [Halobacteriales archaeon]
MSSDERSVSRRGFLRASTGAAAASGLVGTAAAQEDGNETGTGTGSGGGELPGSGTTETVAVGPGAENIFDPAELQVLPGTTVNFTWGSDGHNVVPESIPEGATWEGKGEAGVIFPEGTEYSHTFETLGTYDYVCTPHKSLGMVGAIEVVEEISTPEPAQGPPSIPDPAKVLGLAGTIGIGATLGLAYFIMRFGGGYDNE